jgi:hypothetical protein
MKIVSVLFFCFFLFSCAQVVPPGGGPRDLQAPEAQKFSPSNAGTNFNQQEFSIYFNEYFNIKDQAGQWIISPPLRNSPDAVIKGKKLTVKFKDTLSPNATYSFQFGNSIVDLHEGNPNPGLKYIFSTGPALDSLVLQGRCINTFTKAPEKGLSVWLYHREKALRDSFLFKEAPDYVAIAKEDGSFLINYLPQKEFFALAIRDVNKNFRFDPPEELVGFLPYFVFPEKNEKLLLECFEEEKPQFVKKVTTPEPGKVVINFNRPAKKLSYSWLKPSASSTIFMEHNNGKDTLTLLFHQTGVDTLKLILRDEGMKEDTVEVAVYDEDYFNQNQTASKKRLVLANKPKVNVAFQNGSLPPDRALTLEWARPVKSWNKDSLQILLRKKPVSFTLQQDSASTRKVVIKHDWIEDSVYTLLGFPGLVSDYYNKKADSLKVSFRIKPESETGNLMLEIPLPDSSAAADAAYLVDLLNEKGAVVQHWQTKLPIKHSFELLEPGTYSLRTIEDTNQNGTWDPGKMQEKKSPEKVWLSSKGLLVKASWDLEEKVAWQKLKP